MRRHPLLPALLLAVSVAGCRTAEEPFAYRYGYRGKVVKPVLAVTDFENQANFSGQWNLGGGMAELLVDQLVETEKVVVLERKHLNDVLREIAMQGGDLFRQEGRVERGRLKNAKFLVRGAVTDFTVTGEASGWFGVKSFAARGRGSRARVALSVQVSDIETGEIISSVKTSGKVSAGGFGADVDYKGISFGGDTFFRTPLGKATESALHKAVKEMLRDLPLQYWEPRVAEAGPDLVVVNGGENVRLEEGDRFVVRDDGRKITDPVTGSVLETMPGPVTGRIEVRAVNPRSAHAILLEGRAYRGQLLEPAPRADP